MAEGVGFEPSPMPYYQRFPLSLETERKRDHLSKLEITHKKRQIESHRDSLAGVRWPVEGLHNPDMGERKWRPCQV